MNPFELLIIQPNIIPQEHIRQLLQLTKQQSSHASVGSGEEKIEGKYLVNLGFQSCEGDAAAYTAALENLRTAALAAIERVETAR